jgi:hypothetical protein
LIKKEEIVAPSRDLLDRKVKSRRACLVLGQSLFLFFQGVNKKPNPSVPNLPHFNSEDGCSMFL